MHPHSTIQNILDGMENCDNAVVPLPNIKSATLRKIIEWVNYHKADPLPSNEVKNHEYSFTKVRTVNISPWDAQFIGVDIEGLINLIASVHYLNIKHLLDISSKTLANMIHEWETPEKIQKIFIRRPTYLPVSLGAILLRRVVRKPRRFETTRCGEFGPLPIEKLRSFENSAVDSPLPLPVATQELILKTEFVSMQFFIIFLITSKGCDLKIFLGLSKKLSRNKIGESQNQRTAELEHHRIRERLLKF
uniref:SKP1 component POZ domain-containing protein n=1 Tax=Glossina brevipalpis TaxID=37001 RepID=A0A1A9W5V7_9MUSC